MSSVCPPTPIHRRRPANTYFRLALTIFVRLLGLGGPLVVQGQQYLDDRPPPVAITDRGPVRGFRYTVPELDHVRGSAYLGIPFAEPPVGKLRFAKPVPLQDSWTEVRDATRLPNTCYQGPDLFFGDEFPGSTMWNPNTPLSEDCLYINVWVPDTPSSKPRAVMVWIFGGGFYSGTPTLDCYDGRILAARYDVVLVSIGYRVGVFGYLCFDVETDTCNAGMYDQLLGLDWVQRNARAFGGDPNNVTIFGESAGSVSVSLHLLSPLSRDKFHRAMMQSGSANMPWATTSIAEARQRSEELASIYVNCPKPTTTGPAASQELIECLRGIDPERLVDEQWVSRGILQFPFLPVVDGLFLPQPPDLMLDHRSFKPCPILLGSNRNEGSWFIVYELSDRLTAEPGPHGPDREPIEVRPGDDRVMTRDQFLSAINTLFFYYPQYRQELNSSIVRDAITFQYTDWNAASLDSSSANLAAIDSAVGDSNFVCPLNRFARAYAAAGLPVYMYYFTERYRSSPWPTWMGVLHGDEIIFMLGQVLKEPSIVTKNGKWKLVHPEPEKRLSRAMMRYWSNFAKTSNPNRRDSSTGEYDTDPDLAAVEWPLYGASSREYLELNSALLDEPNRHLVVGRAPRAKQCAFWLDYLPKLMASTGIELKLASFNGTRYLGF